MSHASRTLWMLAFLLLVLPGSSALPAGLLGDAGADDAGGTAATAMVVDYGAYSANLTPGDVDWFAFPALAEGSCLDASFVTSHALGIAIAANGVEVLAALPDAEGLFATTIALAPGTPGIVARPDELPWDAVSAGPYTFDVALAPAGGAVDALATDTDAAGTLASAAPLPATCFTGFFHREGHDIDTVAFAAQAGEVITLSLASANDGTATVVDALGAPVSDAVVAGGAARIAVPATGDYFLVLEGAPALDKYAYTVALAVGPPGQGCRPVCVSL